MLVRLLVLVEIWDGIERGILLDSSAVVPGLSCLCLERVWSGYILRPSGSICGC